MVGYGIVRRVINPFKFKGFWRTRQETEKILIGMNIELVMVTG